MPNKKIDRPEYTEPEATYAILTKEERERIRNLLSEILLVAMKNCYSEATSPDVEHKKFMDIQRVCGEEKIAFQDKIDYLNSFFQDAA